MTRLSLGDIDGLLLLVVCHLDFTVMSESIPSLFSGIWLNGLGCGSRTMICLYLCGPHDKTKIKSWMIQESPDSPILVTSKGENGSFSGSTNKCSKSLTAINDVSGLLLTNILPDTCLTIVFMPAAFVELEPATTPTWVAAMTESYNLIM